MCLASSTVTFRYEAPEWVPASLSLHCVRCRNIAGGEGFKTIFGHFTNTGVYWQLTIVSLWQSGHHVVASTTITAVELARKVENKKQAGVTAAGRPYKQSLPQYGSEYRRKTTCTQQQCSLCGLFSAAVWECLTKNSHWLNHCVRSDHSGCICVVQLSTLSLIFCFLYPVI